MESIGLVYSTFATQEDAKAALYTLMEDGLVTCANVSAPHTAIYPWKGKVCEEEEVAVLFKTPIDKVEPMISKLGDIHPYELPAIIQLDAKSLPDYAAWLAA